MAHLMKSTRGLGLVVELNWDRILYVATISLSLFVGLYIGTLFH